MKFVNSKDEIIEVIEKNEMAIVYFSGTSCGACGVIKTRVEEILIGYPNIKSIEINGEINTELASEYSVFSLPILLLFVEGKEAIRIGRYFDALDLNKAIDRYYGMLF
ncbi:MAG: thioredoxin family protein [Terrisporobacter sp.]|uniref:thioredoxin family protein n=1 Tax=Terrisporobacter sp. TaxID=1965305 RepID=UPI002FC723EB